MRKIKACWV